MFVVNTFDEIRRAVLKVLNANRNKKCFAALDVDSTILTRDANTVFRVEAGVYIRDMLHEKGIPFVYITARPDTVLSRAVLHQDFLNVGIREPKMVIFRPEHVVGCTAISNYKAQARGMIENRYSTPCVLNVGDQWSDLFVLDDAEKQGLNDIFGSTTFVWFSEPSNQFGSVKWNLKLPE